MTITPYTILRIAGEVYDQRERAPYETAFLNAIFDADKDWFASLGAARRDYGAGTEMFEIVKRLATATRNAAYQKAHKAFEAGEEADVMGEKFQQAAE